MRCYALPSGFQLWTFPAGYRVRADGKRQRRKVRPFFLWHYGHDDGNQSVTRKVAASFLLTFRRDITKGIDA